MCRYHGSGFTCFIEVADLGTRQVLPSVAGPEEWSWGLETSCKYRELEPNVASWGLCIGPSREEVRMLPCPCR